MKKYWIIGEQQTRVMEAKIIRLDDYAADNNRTGLLRIDTVQSG